MYKIITHSVIYIYFESQQITVVKFSTIDFMGLNKQKKKKNNNRLLLLFIVHSLPKRRQSK